MSQGDVFRFINQVNETTLQSIIQRLEFRDRNATFTQWRNDYLDQLDFARATQILDVGCGTGVVTRALARRDNFTGKIVGVDHSPTLIEAARTLAAEAHLEERVDFHVGDIHALDFDAGRFDIVVAHTVISHVTDPQTALTELARVTKSGGKLVIFDGDYASWTFGYPPDAAIAKTMEAALLKAVVNNPRILRDLPFMLRQVGLEISASMGYVLAEVGTSSFWISACEAYAPLVRQTGLLPEDQVNQWLTWQREAVAQGYFFASSNYYTFIVAKS